MREYLEAMDRIAYGAPPPAEPSPVVLAALRPKMLELARDAHERSAPLLRAPGAHARGRGRSSGPSPFLAPEQVVVLETDPDRAREIGRRHMALYLALPNYVNNLRWLGYEDADLADGGSDDLVDAIVAWGDEEAIAGRVREHLDAGADHVAVQAYADDGHASLAQLERLAPVLLGAVGPRSDGAAKESNLPSVGLPRPAGFEGRMGHQTPAAPGRRLGRGDFEQEVAGVAGLAHQRESPPHRHEQALGVHVAGVHRGGLDLALQHLAQLLAVLLQVRPVGDRGPAGRAELALRRIRRGR